ncbi:hypothetical protein [Streptomyces angustmyceticus]|uniref:nSTAND1 domain-containing NTPase n=1 Tax=Streptomyces angustmyceticus TaxID=285578 RepID=UPI003D93BE75
MGRPENPIDPQDGPVQRFAYELRKLRDEAGAPAYRGMARRAGYSAATLSQAAAGERLPTLPVLLAYVRACGGEEEKWRRRWMAADKELSEQPCSPEDDTDPPYRGLARFEPGDAELFFGRDELTAQLAGTARRHRVTALVGASGSGKSSLLRAGLVPGLRQTEGPAHQTPAAVRILTPGAHPMAHAERLEPAAGPGETWLLVDQFEELFTVCNDNAERGAFLERLLAARDETSRLRVVLAVRADFFGHCAAQRNLAAALKDTVVLVGPMDKDQLRAAIVKPAVARGLIVERDLTARIIEDVGDEPGALPLMSHALMETWRRRRGRTLTPQAYEAAGGLHGSIARTAEDTYQQLTPAQATLARHILLRLIAPGNGTQDTHRPTARTEFATTEPHTEEAQTETDAVLNRLAHSRLLTLDDGHVRLTHEALITAWPRLHSWITDERDRIRLHRQLTRDTTSWQELDRDPGTLYRGTRLTHAEEAFKDQARNALNTLEIAFLDAAIAARAAEREHAARAARRTRRAAAALAALCALALVVGAVAWDQKQNNDQQHTQAEGRRIATVAASLRTTDPVAAMRLSIAAWHLAHTPETRGALLAAALSQREQDAMALPDGAGQDNTILSDDGRTLLHDRRGRVRRWDVRTHQELPPIKSTDLGSPDAPAVEAVTRDGRMVAVGEDRSTDVYASHGAVGKRVPLYLGGAHVFSGSGRTLLMFDDKSVQLWDWRNQRLLFKHSVPGKPGDPGPTEAVLAVSPDDKYVSFCGEGDPQEVWDVAGNRRMPIPSAQSHLLKHCTDGDLVQFAGDGKGLLTSEDGQGATMTDIVSGRTQWRVKSSRLREMHLSEDGRLLAGRDSDEILVWRTSNPQAPVMRQPIPNEFVTQLRIDPEDNAIRYLGGSAVRTISLNSTFRPVMHGPKVAAATFSPDGRKLVTARKGWGTVQFQLLNTHNGKALTGRLAMPCEPPENSYCGTFPLPALRPDGRLLASGDGDQRGRLFLWDTRTRKRVPIPKDLIDKSGEGPYPLFTADGKSLLAADFNRGRLRVWDMARHTVRGLGLKGMPLAVHPGGRLLVTWKLVDDGHLIDLHTNQTLRQSLTGGHIRSAAFSRDGRFLAVGDAEGRVTLWNGQGNHRLGQLPATNNGTLGAAPEAVTVLAFTSDGKTLATAGERGTLRLWDTASNQPLGNAIPTTTGDAILALAFSPDSRTLHTAGPHAPLNAYAIAPESTTRSLCQRARGGLTRTQWRSYMPSIPYRDTC